MDKQELLVVEKELLQLIQDDASFSKIKGHLAHLYMKNAVTDKYAFRKIFKVALKVLNNKELESFSVDYLPDCIDKCWDNLSYVSFENLSLELMRRLKDVK